MSTKSYLVSAPNQQPVIALPTLRVPQRVTGNCNIVIAMRDPEQTDTDKVRRLTWNRPFVSVPVLSSVNTLAWLRASKYCPPCRQGPQKQSDGCFNCFPTKLKGASRLAWGLGLKGLGVTHLDTQAIAL